MKHKKGLCNLNKKPLFKIRQLQAIAYLSMLLNIILILCLFSIVKIVPFLIGFTVTWLVFMMVYCVIKFIYGYE